MKKFIALYLIILFIFIKTSYTQIVDWEHQENEQLKSHHIDELKQYVKLKKNWGKAKYHSEFDSVLAGQLQFALDSTMTVHNIIGASASLIMPEKGQWNGVYGMSNPVTNDSIRPDMLFGIASCTKTYVATVMLKLAEEGLLSLDDSLHQWLPTYENIDTTITIRQLLNHTSGVSDFANDNSKAYWNAVRADYSAYWSPEKTLSFVLPPNFSPGTSGKYSNTGYILAGMIILESTGDTSFTQTLHKKILDPLNLTNTMVDSEEPLVAELAHGWFDNDKDGIRDDVFNQPRTARWSSAWTAGGMMATAEDLCQFTRAVHRGDVLESASMDEMYKTERVNVGFNLIEDYGLGVEKLEFLDEYFWGHTGNGGWYTAITLYHPENDLSISVLVNQDPYDFTFPDFGPSLAAEELFRVVLNYITGLPEQQQNIPDKFTLSQNYPNPFNSKTVISYQLPVNNKLELSIYNILGQKVATLVSGKQTAGLHTVEWDASGFASGVYIYRLETDKRFIQSRKLILLK